MILSIKNCNNIIEANVNVTEKALNIKFGPNGTGKSTISDAICFFSLKGQDGLSQLLPYNADDPEIIPSVSGLNDLKVRVFNESYMDAYLFKGDNFFEDSFQVFLKNQETDSLSIQISEALKDLQNMFETQEELQHLRNYLPTFFNTVKTNNDKTIKRAGGIKEFLTGNGAGFEKYHEIDSYKIFYGRSDMVKVAKWAGWRNEGSHEIVDNHCPFCTKELDESISNQNEVIGTVFKKSALSAANAILSYLKESVDKKFISNNAFDKFEEYVRDSNKTDELSSELQKLTNETYYLKTKIDKICQFRPMNVTQEQLNDIENNLEGMRIDQTQLTSYYTTDLILDLIRNISDKIDDLKAKTGVLKGLFMQLEKKLQNIIKEREEDINEFFSLAGFPYCFKLQKDGENKAIASLAPIINEDLKVSEPKNHLSWGERNAFALVMFMFEAISDNADIIVLDDPISSFDNNKKFAIMQRMFDGKKTSFKNKTVIMFTHDMQPIIDFVHVSSARISSVNVNAVMIQNNNGIIEEKLIRKNNLMNIVDLTFSIAKDTNASLVTRIVNIRKYIEITNSDPKSLPIYEVLSNIIHGRPLSGLTNIYQDALSTEVFEEGMTELKEYLGDTIDYERILADLTDLKLKEIISQDNQYDRIIALRILLERHSDWFKEVGKKEPGLYKFLNESNHIENDYIFQLDPREYYSVPLHYVNVIENFIQSH